MHSLILEGENLIKNARNLFGLKKKRTKLHCNLFEHEEDENCYKLVRISNFLRNNFIEYENNYGRKKSLSVEEYLDKIRPYLKDINNLKKSGT